MKMIKGIKRGYFFSMDVLVASLLIFSVLLLMSVFYLQKQSTVQTVYYAEDLTNALSELRINDVADNDYVAYLISNGYIDNNNISVMEAIGRLWVLGDNTESTLLASVFLNNTLPSDFGYSVLIGGNPIYTYNKNYSNLISVKKMVSGIMVGEAVEGLSSRIFLKGFNSKIASSYFYFGGFIGEGTITKRIALPEDVVNVSSALLELNVGNDFNLYINGNFSGNFNKTASNMSADRWYINGPYLDYFTNGTNFVVINFTNDTGNHIAGGFLKLNYETSTLDFINYSVNKSSQKYWFPGIDGIINIYDSFYVPGSLDSMDIQLHYDSNYELFLNIGDDTVFSYSGTGENTINLTDGELSLQLNYSSLSNKTVPVRLGLRNVSYALGGKSDAILISDRTSSMSACDVDINCSVGGICDTSNPCHERRDKIAQNSDEIFINEMLSVEGNKVGLVGYGERVNPICSFYDISSNNDSLQNRIDDYYNQWCGYTCISCGIYAAAELLTEEEKLYGSTMKSAYNNTEYHVGDSGPVSVTETLSLAVNKSKFIKSRLTVLGKGVDSGDGYKDCIFFNNYYVGRMCESGDSGWHTCSYTLKEEWLFSSESQSQDWIMTTQANFESCILSNVDVLTSSGNVTLLSSGWWNDDWTKRRELTFDNSAQSDNLQNLTVLVALDNSRIDYGQTQNQGQDIRFINPDGTQLSHEIENWDETGTSYVWVRILQIDGSSSIDSIFMYYGNPSAADDQDPENVWDSGYIAVWHMQNNLDSTSYSNDASCSNCPGSITGRIDGAYNYDGGNDYHTVSNSNEINNAGPWDDKTIELWFKAGSIDSGVKDIIYEQGGGTRGLDIYANNNNLYVGGWNRRSSESDWDPGTWLSTAISPDTWYYVVLRLKDGDDGACADCFKGFLNGNEFASGDGRRLYRHTGDIRIGHGNTRMHDGTSGEEEFDGIIDELRLSNVARSDDWIAAQYLSMNDSFITYASEVDKAGIEQAYISSGTATSPVYDTGGSSDWHELSWSESLPIGTDITLEIRTGLTSTPDATWDNYDWSDTFYDSPDSNPIIQSAGRYIQWKANLSTTNTNVTPVLEEVKINSTTLQETVNNVTITGANTDDCFGTDDPNEQDDWDFKDVKLVAWESVSQINKTSFFDPTEVQIGDPALPQSVTTGFDMGISASKIKSAYLMFEAIDVDPSYYDCVYINDQYIGRIDYQKWSGDNEWQNIIFDVPVMALNSSQADVTIVSGTTYGCLARQELNNDEWRYRNLNLTIRWDDEPNGYNRFMSMLVMSDGGANTKIGTRRGYDSSGADTEAVQKACEAHNNHDIYVYSVAFGNGADEDLMRDIACCDDCDNYYNANNAEELIEIYKEIAREMIKLSFETQAANATGNVSTMLYPDSYIQLNYTTKTEPLKYGIIPVKAETGEFGNTLTDGNFFIPSDADIIDAVITSYSGDKWTALAAIQNTSSGSWTYFYNLSYFGNNYISLGDPFMVNIPVEYVQHGNNPVRIRTALGPQNITGGSVDDKVIYTLGLKTFINYSGVYGVANGCEWTIVYEDNSSSVLKVPPDYNGTKTCSYDQDTYCDTDYNIDAIDNSFCYLLDRLDFDDNGKLSVKLGEENLQLDTLSIGGVPFMWGPSLMEIRVMQ